MSAAKKVSFFTSPIGLGHATRDAAIALQMAELQQDVRISFTSGGAAARLLAEHTGLEARDEYDAPEFNVSSSGDLRNPMLWMYRYYQYYKRCKAAAARIIEEEGPDVVASDEDFASVAAAQQAGKKTVLVTDVMNTRFASRWPGTAIERIMNRSMRSMMSKCDAVIIPEPEYIQTHGNVTAVGRITRSVKKSRDELRRKYRFEKKTVLAAVGGTDAGRFLIRDVIGALQTEAAGGLDAVIVAGPSIQAGSIRCSSNTRIVGYAPDMHEMIAAADVLVSLAGRSTMDEAEATGTPAVLVPITGHFEQEDNASAYAGRHGRWSAAAAGDPAKLARCIAERLAGGRLDAQHSGGAAAAAALLRDVIMRSPGQDS